MDREIIGFLTAVAPSGQPQTSPVWYIRDGDRLVVYNRPDRPPSRVHRPEPEGGFQSPR
jgi:hypothetical protein